MDDPELLEPVRPGIFRIEIPVQGPLQNLNYYLFAGDCPLLLDVPPLFGPLVDALERAIRKAGVSRLERIVLTHAHVDHSGSAAEVSRRLGGRICAHVDEVWRLERDEEAALREVQRMGRFAERCGFPPRRLQKTLESWRRWRVLTERCRVEEALVEGEVVEGGGRRLRVLHTPGHTFGHLCLYEERERILFSGDHLIRSITPNPDLLVGEDGSWRSGLPHFVSSLGKLEDFDILVAYPGHGRPISRVGRRIAFNLEHHRRRLREVLEGIPGRGSTPWELAAMLFPQVERETATMDSWLALREVMGHLEILREEGLVELRELRDSDGLILVTRK
jgi:glyoxylase-like metal-dependent hydrolase (beta-lactamase superfamily II)